MNMSSHFIATSSSAASSPVVSWSLEMSIGSGKPDSSLSVEPSSLDAAWTYTVRLKDTYSEGLWKISERPVPQKDSDNCAVGTWYFQGELVSWNNKALGKTFTPRASSSVEQERQKNTGATWEHCFQILPHTSHFQSYPWSGRSLESKRRILWNICMWMWLFGKMFMNTALHFGKTVTRIWVLWRIVLWKITGYFSS